MGRGRRGIKTAGSEVEHGDNLFSRDVEPLHDFLYTCAGFEVLENGGDRHSRVFKYPRATALAGNAFHGGALGPIESCHVVTLLSIVVLGSLAAGIRQLYYRAVVVQRGASAKIGYR